MNGRSVVSHITSKCEPFQLYGTTSSTEEFMKPIAATAAIAILAVSPSAFANGPKADICHWTADAERFIVINVSTSAVDAHFGNHGDSYPRTYWSDADGDGHGDPNGVTDMCPNVGFVANADDCDDADPMTSPGSDEVCGDAADNNCDGAVDEACISCPCFTLEQVEARYAEADVDTLVDTVCEFDDSFTNAWWEGWWEPFPEESGNWVAREFSVFASYTYWIEDQPYSYCYRSWSERIWSDDEGIEASFETDQYFERITVEQQEECAAIVFDWSEANDLFCIDRTDTTEEE
jgi:hypothetical protein